MEFLLDIQYITNIINLGYSPKTYITQLETLKNKIFFLLNSNDLILFDRKTLQKTQRHFTNIIHLIKAINEHLYIIINTSLILLNDKLCELKIYNLNEKIYLITFIEDSQKKLEFIYVNEKNEIKYYSKKNFSDEKILYLYKENNIVHKIIFQNNILLWTTNISLKVFNLNNKKMLIKKIFNINEELFDFKLIDCYLFNNILCININYKEIILFHLPNEEIPLSFQILNLKAEKEFYFIGMWINSSLNKLSILKYNYKKNLFLEIMKIEDKNLMDIDVTENIYFKKNFNFISNYNKNLIKFIFNDNNIYLYNNLEIFTIILLNKKEKLFLDLNQNNDFQLDDNNIDFIYYNYSNFNLNEQYYILTKIIYSDKNFTKTIYDLNLEKFKYFFNCIFGKKINNKGEDILYNNFILLLLKYKKFLKFYNIIKEKFNKFLNQYNKEKIIEIYIEQDCNFLIKFINDLDNIKITENIEKLFYSKININLNNYKYLLGLLYRKDKKFEKSLELFIDIEKIDEIFDILNNNNQFLIFKYDKLFILLDEKKLLFILDYIYYKEKSECNNFYIKLFELTNNKKISMFTYYLIESDKNYLLIDLLTSKKLFSICLKENKNLTHIYDFSKMLIKFLKNEKMFDFKNLIDENFEELQLKVNYEIYIVLLTLINDYKTIINIYIDIIEDPQKCIKFIENESLNENTKNEIYNYLKDKINLSKNLSNFKKLYFILQFQDQLTNKEKLILNDDNYKEKNKDDILYFIMILDELKLKEKILFLTLDLHKNNIEELKTKYKINKNKGIFINLNFDKNLQYCCFDECIHFQKIANNDSLIYFRFCKHKFHKECLDEINEIYNLNINKYNFCPICENIIS